MIYILSYIVIILKSDLYSHYRCNFLSYEISIFEFFLELARKY
jgi:hypothetical protein